MSVFDRRHRWGEPERKGILLSRTCRVCGLTNTIETLVPDAFIEALLRIATKPNPYRTMFR